MNPVESATVRTPGATRALACLGIAIALASPAFAAEVPKAIADGTLVTLEYTLTVAGEGIVDTNVGKEPLKYTHGEEEIVPGLEKALTGLKPGETKHVELAAKDAYGAYDDTRRITVEKSQLPAEAKAGQILMTADGVPVKLLEVTDEKAVIDVNHPLAGKDLSFDVKVVAIEAAPPAAAAAPAPALDAPK